MGTIKKPAKRRAFVVGEEKFYDIAEYRRWLNLLDREAASEVENLQRQIEYPVQINGKIICRCYVPFKYYDRINKKVIIELLEGDNHKFELIKRMLLEAVWDVEVKVIKLGVDK